MDWMNFKSKYENLFRKYKYVLLVIAVGVVLMLLPSGGKNMSTEQTVTQTVCTQQKPEEKLKAILGRVHGAGRVEVMLTVASGEETVYQTDVEQTSSQDSESVNSKTVIVTDAERQGGGLIAQVNSPVYLGAIIVCDGADDPAVRLSIVDAVSKAIGLGADKISVLKMK